MRAPVSRILFTLGLGLAGRVVAAQNPTTVLFQVQPVNAMSVAPVPLVIIMAAAQTAAPRGVMQAVSSWSMTTNQSLTKIAASIDVSLPRGLTLFAALDAPAGANSRGLVPLGLFGRDLVTNVTKTSAGALRLRYRLDATVDAGLPLWLVRQVTYTVLSGA
jgi:hypothetical protein